MDFWKQSDITDSSIIVRNYQNQKKDVFKNFKITRKQQRQSFFHNKIAGCRSTTL